MAKRTKRITVEGYHKDAGAVLGDDHPWWYGADVDGKHYLMSVEEDDDVGGLELPDPPADEFGIESVCVPERTAFPDQVYRLVKYDADTLKAIVEPVTDPALIRKVVTKIDFNHLKEHQSHRDDYVDAIDHPEQ
jgi:hypothetical protein